MKLFAFKIILIFFLAIFKIATHSGYSVKVNDILNSKKSQENSGYFDFFLKNTWLLRAFQGHSGQFQSGNLAFI